MRTTMEANQGSGQRDQQLLCRYKSVRPQTHPPISLVSLASVEKWAASPLHILFGTECDTHTAPISALGRKLLTI